MKIAVGYFYQESTTFNPFLMGKDAFTVVEGDAVKGRVAATEVLEAEGVEVVPTIFASAISGGCVTEDAYRFVADKMIAAIQGQNVDGVWLHLHGAMEVVGVGSAEADLLKRIRAVVPAHAVISVVMDLHANIHDDVPKLANIIRTYRTAPHVDQEDCERATATLLVDCIRRKAQVQPVFKRVRMITPGEKATTNTEPIKSILAKVREWEARDGILQANYVNGHAWTDRPNTSASIVVVPQSDEYQALAEQAAAELADYAFSRRQDFTFHQLTLDPDEALDRALAEQGKPVFITDSGDNTTGGAPGINTLLLQKLMGKNLNGKKVAVAAIMDAPTYERLATCSVGDAVSVDVGVGYDADSAPVRLDGVLSAKGELLGYYSSKNDVTGHVCTVSVGDIDVVIADQGDSFTTVNHFTRANLDIARYDVLIVKQGYLFDDLARIAHLHIMAMTPGACNLLVENLEFHQLLRPMYPLDK